MSPDMPIGQEVMVERGDGTWLRTQTRSTPWLINQHWVVQVVGIAGVFELARVRPAPPVQVPACDSCTVGIMDQSNPHLHGRCTCSCHVRAAMDSVFRDELSRVDGMEREDIERRRAS